MYKLRIALRYLFAKKSTNAINLVSWVSMAGMGVGAFALVLVLSVFNGFENLVISLYNSFYPELQITASSGKFFTDDEALRTKIYSIDDVEFLSATLEENAYLQYGDRDYIAMVKGVDSTYLKVASLNEKVRLGKFELRTDEHYGAVLGANICTALGINVTQPYEALRINVPRSDNVTVLSPDDAFYTSSALPVGEFAIQQEFDSKYVFVSLDFLNQLLGSENQLSAYELKLKSGANADDVKEKLQELLGKEFLVKTKYEQKETLYRVMKIERWAVYAILSFIMLIVSFNIIGSLLMIVLEKRNDIYILKSMGASDNDVQQIFLLEGVLSALIGAGIGLIFAVFIVLLQQHFGFVKLGNPNSVFVVDAYPVKLKFNDLVLTFATVVGISALASFFPARQAAKSNL
ncbi:MAG TPA: FtsX-like permease family protein [Chitinophagales bacterium]